MTRLLRQAAVQAVRTGHEPIDRSMRQGRHHGFAGEDRACNRVCMRQCCAPFAKAPSLRMCEAVGEQTAIYEELHRLAVTVADDVAGSPALGYIERLSSGDLRSTHPAAHRHNAVMLEAWRLG